MNSLPTTFHHELMSLEEVAQLLGYTNPKSLVNRIHRRKPVPVFIKVPSSKGFQFFRRDVYAFLEQCRVAPLLLCDQDEPSSPEDSISALWNRPVSESRRSGAGKAGNGKRSIAGRSGTKAPGRSFAATSDARRCV